MHSDFRQGERVNDRAEDMDAAAVEVLTRNIIRGRASAYQPHACESVTTADGHGAYCKHCGDTLA